jgi:hypothetical protein
VRARRDGQRDDRVGALPPANAHRRATGTPPRCSTRVTLDGFLAVVSGETVVITAAVAGADGARSVR